MTNQIQIETTLSYRIEQPTDMLLQVEAAANIPEQKVLSAHIDVPNCEHFQRVLAHDEIGERIWLRTDERLNVDYRATIEIARIVRPLESLTRIPPHKLPGETVQYMLDSLYCPALRFNNFVEAEFGELDGGARIAAMRDWIGGKLTYASGSSTAVTTALDTFVERRGVCRDYAHLMITLARASEIPARIASVYAVGVEPQDFHAVAEVFLDNGEGVGEWHLVDATGMSQEGLMAKVGVGRDAADVGFLTVYGQADMENQQVRVSRV